MRIFLEGHRTFPNESEKRRERLVGIVKKSDEGKESRGRGEKGGQCCVPEK